MKKGILIIVAIILMILAVFPVVDYFFTKNLVYGKGEINNYTEYEHIQQYIGQDLNLDRQSAANFFKYFKYIYNENGIDSITFNALEDLWNTDHILGGSTLDIVPYICYIVDLFLVWFILFAILQVPIFTMRLMGLKEDKGGKRL